MKLILAIKRRKICINKVRLSILGIVTCFVIFSLPAYPIEAINRLGIEIPDPPSLNARSAILIDAATGTILYEKEADLRLPPASLAKLVTLHIAMELIKTQKLLEMVKVV